MFAMVMQEFYFKDGKVTMETMFEDQNFGLDPLGFEKNRSCAGKDTMA
jgi:hypothetical protein